MKCLYRLLSVLNIFFTNYIDALSASLVGEGAEGVCGSPPVLKSADHPLKTWRVPLVAIVEVPTPGTAKGKTQLYPKAFRILLNT